MRDMVREKELVKKTIRLRPPTVSIGQVDGLKSKIDGKLDTSSFASYTKQMNLAVICLQQETFNTQLRLDRLIKILKVSAIVGAATILICCILIYLWSYVYASGVV